MVEKAIWAIQTQAAAMMRQGCLHALNSPTVNSISYPSMLPVCFSQDKEKLNHSDFRYVSCVAVLRLPGRGKWRTFSNAVGPKLRVVCEYLTFSYPLLGPAFLTVQERRQIHLVRVAVVVRSMYFLKIIVLHIWHKCSSLIDGTASMLSSSVYISMRCIVQNEEKN